jgi:hypothetical protein
MLASLYVLVAMIVRPKERHGKSCSILNKSPSLGDLSHRMADQLGLSCLLGDTEKPWRRTCHAYPFDKQWQLQGLSDIPLERGDTVHVVGNKKKNALFPNSGECL